MCFSAEASFAVAGVLLPSGLYCLRTAARKDRRLLPIAAVPLLFGLQQASEGFVWIGLHHEDEDMTRLASLGFLFAALALWPFWVPFMMWAKEDGPGRRRLLLALIALSIAWFFVLFLPIAMGPPTLLTTRIDQHSITYAYPDVPLFQVLPAGVRFMLYGLMVILPLVLSFEKESLVPGLVVAASLIICFLFYRHAYISVWCFFAAILSAYLVWVFWVLPEPLAA
jgi:hypothetical protein